ncbi:beta-1,4-galactosyltransferase galt-1-like [Uloborus diversus]|uniref:beta-1,4-galactosyltransferase galt-1-like n=1 Tax=Uloborus diversus TaxID=327109 RepID=UPI00240A15B2|nr:beta-1,4-galactosyltransferase galt-1-like [Uloborus diversus]
MSTTKQKFRAARFKYTNFRVFKRFLTTCNFIILLSVVITVSIIMTIQKSENEEIFTSKLDEFHAATQFRPSIQSTMKPQSTKKQTTAVHAHIQTGEKINNVSKITPDKFPQTPPMFSPKFAMPIIKIRSHPRHVNKRLKTTEERMISPKRLKYRDFVDKMARSKSFPSESPPKMNDKHVSTGMNDWIRANSPRDQTKFLVYSAFWDDRFDENYVRIMAIMVTKNPPPVYCKLQMMDGTSQDVRVTRKIMNEHWRLKYASYFLSCVVAKNVDPPLKVLVSLQRNFTYSAMLPVHQNKENIVSPRGEIAVCVKPFHYYYDRATWLLEFIELHRIFGVEHFYFYNHSVGSSVDALLRYYMTQNIVTVLPWNLPIRSQKEVRTEGIFSSLNDCVFRTMYLFHYVVMLDFDEYIIPREHDTYLEMIQQLEEDNKRIRGKPGSFVFKNTFFYLYWENDTTAFGAEPETPPLMVPYLITQYKTRRLTTTMKVGSRSKYIIVPERVIEVGNHVVWRHTSGSRAIPVPDTVALLHHYRICEFGGFSCMKKESLVDRTAQRFAPELLKRVLRQCRMVYTESEGKCPLSPPLGSPW